MNTSTIFVALIWGATFGLLCIHTFANLLAIIFALHGILLTRWKRLSNKAAPGIVKYGVNLNLVLKATCFTLLFAGLLSLGDDFVGKQFQFRYNDNAAYLFGAAAALTAAFRANTLRKKLQIIWRMSHNLDYAERRRRTKLLKS